MSEVDHPVHQQFRDDELRAIVETAGLADRVVMAHCHGKPGIMAALRAGVKTIEHGTYLDDEACAAMVELDALLVPTRLIVVRLMKAHLLPSEVEEAYEKRFGPDKRETFDLKAAPLRGEASAPITLVEFSDFQCPHCKALQPVLEKLLDEYRGKVRLFFKNYPITRAHPDAALSAAAALAAGKQGKFWAFHDRLFGGDQLHQDMAVLEKIAKARLVEVQEDAVLVPDSKKLREYLDFLEMKEKFKDL